MNTNNGISLDGEGDATPYSATSTAVSESGDAQKVLVDESLSSSRSSPGDHGYFANLLASSNPVPSTKAGTTTFGSAIEVLEALAVQHSDAVWVYDDASEVGFGRRAVKWIDEDVQGSEKVFALQTREGAGLELAGYANRATSSKISVFATLATLPYLLPSLDQIKGDVVIHLATTTPNATLEFSDSLAVPGVFKSLTGLPDGWNVVFSAGSDIVDAAAKIYGSSGKTIQVVESTYSGREVSSFTFPAVQAGESAGFEITNKEADEVLVVPAGSLAISIAASLSSSKGLLQLTSLAPNADQLFAALTAEKRKTVSIIASSKVDAEALKAVVLSSLYSASSSSKAVLPTIKTVVSSSASDFVSAPVAIENSKTIAFFTAPLSPLPELLSHLFLSSPNLQTRLAQFGSSAARGVKSILSLAPASASAPALTVDTAADVAWVSDANVHKFADVLANLNQNGILVLELPWTEEEVPVKLSRSEIIAIKEKNIRVFLLDLDPTCPINPLREQAAFLLLYTGKQKLPQGVWKVLDAFHNGNLGREPVEDAQAALIEVSPSQWTVPELEEGKTEKVKSAWEWDALAGQDGIVSTGDEQKPQVAAWDLAARHLLFREAFAVPEAKVVDEESSGLPGIAGLRPSMADETFLVKVSENRRLTPQTYDRNVFHLELDSTGTGLKYEIGEAIGIHGWNDAQEVLEFCSWYGLEPDAVVTFPNPLKAGTMESRTTFQLLQQNVDLFGQPGKAFYAELAKIATLRSEAMTLKFISAPEGAELFKRMAESETVTFADVLQRFPTARPSIETLVGLIPEIKPRHYSIASSQKAVGDKVELLIVTVDWVDSKGQSSR
jgi:sulfite reductase (NADPH) flavoprotein alpha-component